MKCPKCGSTNISCDEADCVCLKCGHINNQKTFQMTNNKKRRD